MAFVVMRALLISCVVGVALNMAFQLVLYHLYAAANATMDLPPNRCCASCCCKGGIKPYQACP